jgi:hypothetical protein
MKLVRLEFNGWLLAMMEDSNGNVFCTSRALCNALGLTAQELKHTLRRYGSRLHPLRISAFGVQNGTQLGTQNESLRDFLNEYKATFSIKYLRDDMLLWPLQEALGVAFHVHTELAWEFHQAAIRMIVEHARASAVSREEFEALQQEIRGSQPFIKAAASAAGIALQAQKGTKALRELN